MSSTQLPVAGGPMVSLLRLGGEIEQSACESALLDGLAVVALDAPCDLVIDLSEVTFIDSAGVGVLLRVRRNAIEAGCTVRVTGPQPKVRRIFEIYGLVGLLGL